MYKPAKFRTFILSFNILVIFIFFYAAARTTSKCKNSILFSCGVEVEYTDYVYVLMRKTLVILNVNNSTPLDCFFIYTEYLLLLKGNEYCSSQHELILYHFYIPFVYDFSFESSERG